MIAGITAQAAAASSLSVGIVETAAALETTATGVVFDTLVDDPASVGEFLDAYLGEIMLEAASAVDVLTVPMDYTTTITEAATASSTQDGALGAALATFDGTATDVTMSNGNLTATHANTNNNAGVRSASTKNLGKYYWEVTVGHSTGAQDSIACLNTADSFASVAGGFAAGMSVFCSNGAIQANFGGGGNVGAISSGSIVSFAVDINMGTPGGKRGWLRVNGGNWNGNSSHNPATNVGGVLMGGALDCAPAVTFAGSGTAAGDNFTGNFGQSAYAYTPPSGFSNWPA